MPNPTNLEYRGDQEQPTLYLHIGHPKTGSSAFQAFLASNADHLRAAGIFYPHHDSFAAAARGYVSSGNLPLGDLTDNWLLARVLPVVQQCPEDCRALLFSNENLLHRMAEFYDAVDFVLPYCKPHVLLAVRNPLDQLASVYQQLVKRHGFTADYNSFLSQHRYRCNALHKSAQIAERLDQMGIDYTLLNYSVLGRGIVPALGRCAGFPEELLSSVAPEAEDASPVNRSLSASELQLVLLTNSIHGRDAGRRLADALVNRLPDVQPVKLAMDPVARHCVEFENQTALKVLNARLPAEAPLTFAGYQGDPVAFHCGLTSEQLALCRDVFNRAAGRDSPRVYDMQRQLLDRLIKLLNKIAAQCLNMSKASRRANSG
ncbi:MULTISPECIES: hypothetical protein [unclassified Cyanobium]|uniref:hypothetical protein n=1 Tax=unclassified Cyanobium TaxID=2627006 RepID=UPI0020CD4A85|nr:MULTISPECIES: hypothetical protein [unclassified Cyanobium]MCP9778592.1 hypothetical protein [Cyanobium sp. Tous-M-B4]MCP9876224.1 hypothetical protein [Cyanobium sp. A2C-AMD]